MQMLLRGFEQIRYRETLSWNQNINQHGFAESEQADIRGNIGELASAVTLADEVIHLLQAALPVGCPETEFAAVAEQNLVFCIAEHGVADIDLLPGAVGNDPVTGKSLDGEEHPIGIHGFKGTLRVAAHEAVAVFFA